MSSWEWGTWVPVPSGSQSRGTGEEGRGAHRCKVSPPFQETTKGQAVSLAEATFSKVTSTHGLETKGLCFGHFPFCLSVSPSLSLSDFHSTAFIKDSRVPICTYR